MINKHRGRRIGPRERRHAVERGLCGGCASIDAPAVSGQQAYGTDSVHVSHKADAQRRATFPPIPGTGSGFETPTRNAAQPRSIPIITLAFSIIQALNSIDQVPF
ncbi:hypothetical protein GCM10022293_15860 [Azospirillum formosense]